MSTAVLFTIAKAWKQPECPSVNRLPTSVFWLLLLLLLLLSHFSRVRLSATPETAAHQAPPPLGFSRQGVWTVNICLRRCTGCTPR